MAVLPLPTHRVGAMRCCNCKSEFTVRPGPHAVSMCPVCGSLYYEWLDYDSFKLESAAEGRQGASNTSGTRKR